MQLHRLTAISYMGGLPGTHDYLNDPVANGDIGVPANADSGKKSSGPNEGTYFIAFGEDGTSDGGNRSHEALGESTDFLDDVVSGELPVPTNLDGTASGSTSEVDLTGDVFVGKSGIANNQDERDRLITIVESATGNEIITSAGTKVTCSDILDGPGGSSIVGSPATGFQTAPTVKFTPAIPSGTNYRLIYAKRGSLVSIVPSKTDLDALTRLAIRGAHEVPAETQRFIREAGRRVGGAVAALCGTIFETPGLGENILGVANAMFMDVDPDASVGTGGAWSVRFDRGGTPKIHMRVNEGTGGDSSWENVVERLAFKDTNIAGAGFTETAVPLTSSTSTDGDDHLRLLEADPGVPFSILKRLNAQWTVTVGDGSTTFGDYNGSAAITTAVAAAIALSRTSLRIRVKPGSYEVDGLAFTGMDTVVIEGTSPRRCQLQNEATAGTPGVICGNLQSVYLQHLSFTNGGNGSTVAIRVDAGETRIADCSVVGSVEFNAQASTVNTGVALHVARSVITATATDAPPVLISGGSGIVFNHHGIVFDDCLLLPFFINTPAVRLVDNDGAGSPTLSGILFNRCRIYLKDSTVSAGDMVGNSGVFELVLGSLSNLIVKDIEWRDCEVTVNGTDDVKCLMMLRTGDGVGSVDFQKITISGGRWELPQLDSDLAPFFIGGQGDTWDTTAPREIVIKDVVWSFTAGTRDYGAAHAVYNSLGVGESAGFALVADKVRMWRVKWLTTTTLSTNGDLLVDAQVVDIDTLDFPTVMGSGGLGATPNYRIKIVAVPAAGSDADSRVANVKMRCGFSGGASSTVWRVESSGPLLFDKCTAENFTGGTIHGFFVPSVTTRTRGIHLSECEVGGNSGSGFFYNHDGSVQSDGLSDIVFDRCRFIGNGSRGIYLAGLVATSPEAFERTHIVNCVFAENSGFGVQYSPAVEDAAVSRIIMIGCLFEENNSGGDQVQFGESGNVQGYQINGIVMGNHLGFTLKGIHFFNSTGQNPAIQGVETGYDSSGPTISSATDKLFVDDQLMLHNVANYSDA